MSIWSYNGAIKQLLLPNALCAQKKICATLTKNESSQKFFQYKTQRQKYYWCNHVYMNLPYNY